MRKIICGIVLVGLMVVFAPPAYAANDCCWDWIPGLPGRDDDPSCPNGDVDCAPDLCLTDIGDPCPTGGEGCVCDRTKKAGSDPDPENGAIAGWAECTPTPKARCFKRENVQMYWVNWTCVPGSVAPNGAVPGDGNGYGCREKPEGTPEVNVAQDQYVTFPAEEPGPTDIMKEKPGKDAPAVSTVGAVVLVVFLIGGAAWIFRHKRASATPAA